MLAGPIKHWWNENWKTPAHLRYEEWRNRLSDALIAEGYLVYRPHGPHVLGRGRQVTIAVDSHSKNDRPTKLILDGETALLQISDPVSIGLSDETVTFVQLEHDSFHTRLEEKRLGRS